MTRRAKRRKVEIVDATPLAIALGYHATTVDSTDWNDGYVKNTLLISKAFYKAFVELRIRNRITLCERVKICSGGCRAFNAELTCGHELKDDMLFTYHKFSEVLSRFSTKQYFIEFSDGKPTTVNWRGNSISCEYKPCKTVMPVVYPHNIVLETTTMMYLIDMPVSGVWNDMWKCGYRYNGFDKISRIPSRMIRRGDTAIVLGIWGPGSDPLPYIVPGMNKIYLVDILRWRPTFSGYIDKFGAHKIGMDGNIWFTPWGHRHGPLNKIEYCYTSFAYNMGTPYTFWDFTHPIPRRYLMSTHIIPCSEPFIERVEKN